MDVQRPGWVDSGYTKSDPNVRKRATFVRQDSYPRQICTHGFRIGVLQEPCLCARHFSLQAADLSLNHQKASLICEAGKWHRNSLL